jgi:RNA polymerase sigma-70 factor, ECF subfamily
VVDLVPEERTPRARSEGASVEDLVRRSQTGSSTAFGELVERFESPLVNFLIRRTRSAEDAEDLAQETFVRAWQKLDRYDERFSFSTWLFTLARRLAATRGRFAAPASQGEEALLSVTDPSDPGRSLSQSEEHANLWSIADRVLGDDSRSALWLRYAEDLSIPEIARILGRSSVSVRVMLFRARGRLAKFLVPEQGGASAVSARGKTARWREAEV